MHHSSSPSLPWWQRFVYLFLQLAGFLVLLVLHFIVLGQLAKHVLPPGQSDTDISTLIIVWSSGLLAVLNSAYLLDFFQQRLGFSGLGFTRHQLKKGLLTGLVVGGGIIFLSFLILLIGGWVEVTSIDLQAGLLLSWLIFFLIQPLTEEVVMRSVLQTQIHRYFGHQAGLVLTALCFAAMHSGNDAFSWVAGLEIFLGGYLMGQLYLVSQSIWAPFLMHASWNFLQSTVLGFAVSGMDTYHVFHLKIDGPTWLTGGAFGLEASWLTIILLLVAIFYFWDTPNTTPWLTTQEKRKLDIEPMDGIEDTIDRP